MRFVSKSKKKVVGFTNVAVNKLSKMDRQAGKKSSNINNRGKK